MSLKMKMTQAGIAVALGLGAGCGTGGTPGPAMNDPKYIEASIQQSFERLQALSIVDVGRLVIDLPSEATACYGQPCAGSEWVKPYQEERARQAPRLEKLAALAEQVSKDQTIAPKPMSESEAAITALANLKVVEVVGLVKAEPANNPLCYSLPCPVDVEAAEKENGLRVARAQAIAAGAEKSGL